MSNGWIDCKERMPEDGDYLVFDGHKVNQSEYRKEYGGFAWPYGVTHWMELPAPPAVQP